ncbi:hypothetical protein Tco_0343664 [Tanacetum coccineum]
MHTTSLQNTTIGSKPNPKSNNQISRSLPVSKSSCGMSNGVSLVDHSRNSSSFSDSKHFVCSTCHKCVFNANHDNCITKFLKEVNSRAKVQSPKTRNNNKPVEPKSQTQKPGRQMAIGQRFSLNKSSAVHEKPNTPRSCLRWISTGRIFKLVGLRWTPTGKMFIDSTTKVDSEPPNGSNEDITNPYECDQTLNVSAGTLNLSADTSFNPNKERLRFRPRSSTIKWRLFTSVQASLFNDKMTFEQNGSILVLQSFMTSVHISLGLALQQHMASADNTSGPAAQRKERCTLQYALSSEGEKSLVRFINMIHAFSMLVLLSSGSTTPSSTRIDQDTPSTSTSQTTQEEQSHVIPTSVEEDDHGIEVAHMDNDLISAGRYLLQTLGQEKLEFLMKKVGMQSMSPETMKKLADETEELWTSKGYESTHNEDGNPSRANIKQALVGFNSLVHSFRALSTLRCSGLRTASAAAKPCQGDSSEFYLITGYIYTDKQGTVACRSKGHYITWRQYFTTRMIKRFTVADNLKECSRITIKDKSKELCSKITTCRTMTVLEESKTTSQSQRSTHRTIRFKL